MSYNTSNASPKHIALGTEDKSTRVVYPAPPEEPQHQPKFYIFAEKGPLVPTPCNGAKALEVYGEETFLESSKYYTHATLFASRIMAEGNEIIIQRVLPEDTGDASVDPRSSSVILMMDIEATTVSITRGTDGELLPAPVDADGYKVKYYSVTKDILETILGGTYTGLSMPGFLGNSTMYPILELDAAHAGSYYDSIGITIEPLIKDTLNTNAFDEGTLTYALSVYEKELVGKFVTRTIDSDIFSEFSFTENSLDPITNLPNSMNAVFPENWSNESDPLYPIKLPEFKDVVVHHNNINTILGLMASSEMTYLDTLSVSDKVLTDFHTLSAVDNIAMMNFITLKDGSGKNYNTIVKDTSSVALATDVIEIDLSTNIPLYMRGGQDGNNTIEALENSIITEMSKYLDPNSEVIDMAVNTESIIYDSGFKLDTKLALCNFVGLRKDTFVALTTHVHTDIYAPSVPSTVGAESSIAAVLKTKLRLMPDSTYFGTPVMRGLISMGSGLLVDGTYKHRVPQLLDIATKAARYMGAGNGAWKPGFIFDTGQTAIVSILKDLQPKFIAGGTKPSLWRNGLVWSQPFDRVQYHYPAMQTVYENDTSVLNSFWTAMAICTLNKYNDEAWRRYTGSTKLSDLELADEIEGYITNRVNGKFDGLFTIRPTVTFTDLDKAKGYSWTLVTEIFANNMKTVMVSRVVSRRASDLLDTP